MSPLRKIQNEAKLICSFRTQESSVFWEREWRGKEESFSFLSIVPFHDLNGGYMGVYILWKCIKLYANDSYT